MLPFDRRSVLAFVNSRSGGQAGTKVLARLEALLGEQVFDLARARCGTWRPETAIKVSTRILTSR